MKNIVLPVLFVLTLGVTTVAPREGTTLGQRVHDLPVIPASSTTTHRYVAPDFTLANLKKNEVTLSKYRGSVVIMMFWTTW